MNKFLAFLLMLLLVISTSQAARPLSAQSVQQRYSKIFATLGVVCKCCDGSGGECSSTWTQSCSQPHLKCLPWKLH